MSQHYSDTKRESDAYSLPDVETYQAQYSDCPECGALTLFPDDTRSECPECAHSFTVPNDSPAGWFYWFCLPGCLPDSEPMGPFDTESEALADARDGMDDDDSLEGEFVHDDGITHD
jgi:hypothetical protein